MKVEEDFMRRPILAGNWKMNKTRDEAIHFVLGVDYKLPKNGVDCIICAPAIILRDIVKRADILQVGAQNMNENDKGAYTGEISPIMLKDTGVKYVIIGHSERRQYYNETDSIVNAKIKKALEYDLKPIVCVGEDLSERESKLTNNVLERQITKAFEGVEFDDPENIVVAYEPIWAMGTGKAISSKDLAKMVETIRKEVADLYSEKAGNSVDVVYGGNVNLSNYKKLLNNDQINGALISEAALDVDNFAIICKENY